VVEHPLGKGEVVCSIHTGSTTADIGIATRLGLGDDRHDAMKVGGSGRKPRTMFKILELKSAESTPAAEVGRGYSTREEALIAIKRHLKTFHVSGHNSEGNYWWARDTEGLRKCWISSVD
jgi:hypothetical protein